MAVLNQLQRVRARREEDEGGTVIYFLLTWKER
jgi:hypothetical protein